MKDKVQSIYLEYYSDDVLRKEGYVKIHEDRENKEALALARAIQSKRIVEVKNAAYGFKDVNK